MRVLFVTWDGPGLTYLEGLFLPIFKGLKASGFDFDVLQFRWGEPEQQRKIVRMMAEAGIGYRPVQVYRWGGNLGPFTSAILGGRHIRRAIKDFKSDVVMPRSVLPAVATLAARASKIRPVLYDSDGLDVDERVEFGRLDPTAMPYRVLRDAEAQLVRLSRGVLVRSRDGANVLEARAGAPFRPDHFFLVANGRDARRFTPLGREERARIRAGLGIGEDAPLVVYAGSVGYRYKTPRTGDFALALRELRPDTRLLILSATPDVARDELIGRMPELEGMTTIMSVPPSEVATYVAAADVGTAFIHASFATRAVSPVKTGEYLLSGLPLVGTREVGDNEALIRAGLFFDEARGFDAAAQWVVDTVLPNRDALRDEARRIGLESFSLTRSVADYEAALAKFRRPYLPPANPFR